MSRASMEDLMSSLRESQNKKKKKLVISLNERRYKELITAIVLENNGREDIHNSYQEVINKIIDLYLDSVDFYDLTEDDMDRIVNIFEEVI